MKRKTLALLLSLALCMSLFSTALAAEAGNPGAGTGISAQELAGKLKSLGLFLGDENGNFNLDKAPTRIEALIMLIRALGEETQAKAAGKTHSFTDVPAWADGYVSWGYAKGYTNGVSTTEFGSNSTAGAEMYLTFMLRALGYSDKEGGQFAWDMPYLLAYQTHILPFEANYVNFTRGDAVLVTSAALFADLADGSQALADRLTGQGAFTVAEFSAQFPKNPFSWEITLADRVKAALDEAIPTGQTDRKTVNAQTHIMTYAVADGDTTTVYALAASGSYGLQEDGMLGSTSGGTRIWRIDLGASTGEILSCTEDYEHDKWPLSIEEHNAWFELLSPSLFAGAEAQANALLSSGEAAYIPPTYDQAVAELRSGTGHSNERTFETDECTVFVYDRGGFMNAPKGAMTVIYKPGSQLGEGTVIDLPFPRAQMLRVCTPADTMELSADGKTFTYVYHFDEPLIVEGVTVRGAGDFIYTVDLTTGEVTTQEPEAPAASYEQSLTKVTQAEGFTVEKTLEAAPCTVVLGYTVLEDGQRNYTLTLVMRDGNMYGNGYYANLVLPVTATSGLFTNRAPDKMEISADGTLLSVTYNETLYDGSPCTLDYQLATGART